MTPRFLRWWCIGFVSGVGLLTRARNLAGLKQALRLVLCPIDLWRYYEIAAVRHALSSPTHVLDIGSPKIAAPVLGGSNAANFICTDIAWNALESPRRARASLQSDALHLPFADGSIPFVYSISAIEHIAENGDVETLREIARVLAPGGTAVLTVPLVTQFAERWVDADPYGKQARDAEGRIFFSRYYDWDALQARILRTPGLRVTELYAWQEICPGWYEHYCRATERPFSLRAIVTKLLDIVWAARRIEFVRGGPEMLTRHGVAAIVLVKE